MPLSKWASVQRKRARVISEKEKKITAYHESGHAILFHVLPDVDPVYTDLDHPDRSGGCRLYHAAAGTVMRCLTPRGKMLQDIMVALWRTCRRGDSSSMISPQVHLSDIKQATTAIAKSYGNKIWYVRQHRTDLLWQ